MEVILSVKFGYEKTPEIDGLLRDFKDMVNFCIDKAVQHKATSISKLHRLVYGELSQRYDYSRAFFPTAYRVALSIVRGWIDNSPKCSTCGLDRHVAGAMNILAKYVGSLGSPRNPQMTLMGEA